MNQNVSKNNQITWNDALSVLKSTCLMYGPMIIASILQQAQAFNYGEWTYVVTFVIGVALKFIDKYLTKTVYPVN